MNKPGAIRKRHFRQHDTDDDDNDDYDYDEAGGDCGDVISGRCLCHHLRR